MKKHHTMTAKKSAGAIAVLATAVAVIEPIMTVPQAWEIWANRSAQNIAPIGWVFSIISASIWLIYGIKLKSKPVIVSSVCWFAVESVVLAGIFTFRSK